MPLSSGTATPVRRLWQPVWKSWWSTVCGKIINNTQHLLYCLLPPQREQHYELTQRVYNFQLPTQSSSLLDSNYFMWILFKNTGCALSTAFILWHCITALDMLYYFLLYWHYLAAFHLLFYIILMNEWMVVYYFLRHSVDSNFCCAEVCLFSFRASLAGEITLLD